MTKKIGYGDPAICTVLLLLMVFEVPVFNVYLVAPTILFFYYAIIMRKGFIVGWDDLLLAAFIISYFVIDSVLEYSTLYKVMYASSLICAYMCGKRVLFQSGNINFNSIKVEKVIRIFAYAYFTYVLITIVYSVANGQFLLTRNPLNLWTGTLRAATHYGTMLVFPAAYGIYLLVSGLEKRKIIGGAIVVFCIAVSVMTASRTIIYMIPLGIVVCVLAEAKFHKTFNRRLAFTVGGLTVVVLTLFAMFQSNAFGIQDSFLSTQLGQRIMLGQVSTFKEDGRMVYNMFLFNHLSESFLGGGYTRLHSGRLHNLFLNVYDMGGIIPLSFLMIFFVKAVRKLNMTIKRPVLDAGVKTLVFLLYILVFVQMMLEPVMESVPIFVWCFLYVAGVMHSVARQ